MAAAVVLAVVTGCEPAHRFPRMVAPPPEHTEKFVPDTKPVPISPNDGWLEPLPTSDVPLVFVPETAAEWAALPLFAEPTSPEAGLPSPGLGPAPLEAAIIARARQHWDVARVKVPRGLPDPTRYVPPSNPPTYGKWALGRKLFFDGRLLTLAPGKTRACADCHVPDRGFTHHDKTTAGGTRNVPSLINCVYNEHQFWDGRATSLEEVILRQLEDERPLKEEPIADHSPAVTHVWPGLVKAVKGKNEYLVAFQRVFGRDPSADSIAKALATYMRTLLSGDSIYDRADANRIKRGKEASMQTQDFEAALADPALLQKLPGKLTAAEAARQLATGYGLFAGKAKCSACHSGNLFTDQSFHNVGVGDSADFPLPGKEPGRFAALPYGLKEVRWIGAYRTPGLRNVSLTAPYMHDGSLATLKDVLKHYNEGLTVDFLKKYLDPLLQTPPGPDGVPQALRLGLSNDDLAALELFLHALRGNDLPAALTAAPK
jgi:cytochrome c peroxidase